MGSPLHHLHFSVVYNELITDLDESLLYKMIGAAKMLDFVVK